MGYVRRQTDAKKSNGRNGSKTLQSRRPLDFHGRYSAYRPKRANGSLRASAYSHRAGRADCRNQAGGGLDPRECIFHALFVTDVPNTTITGNPPEN